MRFGHQRESEQQTPEEKETHADSSGGITEVAPHPRVVSADNEDEDEEL